MEAIPDNMPEARGKEVTMSCFVDADHAGMQRDQEIAFRDFAFCQSRSHNVVLEKTEYG
jgi:hypothetical protein